jgi:hypothetical protein
LHKGTFDINDSSKAVEVFVKLVNEIQKDVETVVLKSF